jgi:hypothetical protein
MIIKQYIDEQAGEQIARKADFTRRPKASAPAGRAEYHARAVVTVLGNSAKAVLEQRAFLGVEYPKPTD